MRIAALDIGGARIKVFGPDGKTFVRAFELWRRPGDLAAVLVELLAPCASTDRLLVTMTGELCDCFETKAEGVRHIVRSVVEAAHQAPHGWREPEIRVWRTDGRFVSIADALADPLPSAAANWLALALFAGRFAPHGHALLVDTGSTTTDIIPLEEGRPAPRGFTDTERLLLGELVYTGASRTPIAAVARDLPYRSAPCPVSAELFATTLDAYLILGLVEEDPEDCLTADGRPATKAFARERLARMVCADRDSFDDRDALEAARHIEREQAAMIQKAVRKVSSAGPPPSRVIISGSGEFLARRAVECLGARIVSLALELGDRISEVAPAYALVTIASSLGGEMR